MSKIVMKKGDEIISVEKTEVEAKKKEGYKITSKYALKKHPIISDKK